MAMTPEEREKMDRLEQMVLAMFNVEDVAFIGNLERRLNFVSGTLKLSDLSDVSGTDSASTGEVLKKTATTWQPGTDNIA